MGKVAGYRGRMNSWSFAELQRQIQYKADWNGIPVIYVRAFGTSAKCSKCGHHVLPEENRKLHCPNCLLTIDRDVNAARNILARGLRFKPVGSASEAMVQEPPASGNLESRCRPVNFEAHNMSQQVGRTLNYAHTCSLAEVT